MERVSGPIALAMVATLLVIAMVTFGLTGLAEADSGSVAIQNFAFAPVTLTIPVGSTVTWTNDDSAPHTTTSDYGSAFSWSSGTLSQGASFQVTFTQAGTFTYHCVIHPFMTGTIKVEGAGGPTTGPTASATSVPATAGVPTVPSAPTPTTAVPPSPTPTSAPTAKPSGTSSSKKPSKTISAKSGGSSFVFSPSSTTVKVGTTVTWVNRSQAPHTITSTVKRWKFNKGLNAKSVRFTFKKAGVYLYHCTFHPGMNGKIVVKG